MGSAIAVGCIRRQEFLIHDRKEKHMVGSEDQLKYTIYLIFCGYGPMELWYYGTVALLQIKEADNGRT